LVDFGTGYSSLSYLRRFPFDRLKIDRSFVAELGVDAGAEAIVRCIIAMSRSLRLEVTAEGVESELQLSLLRTMQCGYVQGFLLGRPAAANDMARSKARQVVAA
jgi:EAL domain-containing protein (putative c-di-GMP-specific phosphodiesterase class I)